MSDEDRTREDAIEFLKRNFQPITEPRIEFVIEGMKTGKLILFPLNDYVLDLYNFTVWDDKEATYKTDSDILPQLNYVDYGFQYLFFMEDLEEWASYGELPLIEREALILRTKAKMGIALDRIKERL